ncbi:MAG: SprT-like domain-containing protein [Fimbriimonadaceae bacterium]|nr:SprT-like domain-containing protein [Fimbriimonadaceae bacterium]
MIAYPHRLTAEERARLNAFEGPILAKLAELRASHPVRFEVTVTWKALRVSAGLARWRIGEIVLSARVLRELPDVIETLVHEYAHLYAVDRYGPAAANHGPAWQAAMRAMGYPPIVRHKLPVERKPRERRFQYPCARCGFILHRVQPLRSDRVYLHLGCGGEFRQLNAQTLSKSAA